MGSALVARKKRGPHLGASQNLLHSLGLEAIVPTANEETMEESLTDAAADMRYLRGVFPLREGSAGRSLTGGAPCKRTRGYETGHGNRKGGLSTRPAWGKRTRSAVESQPLGPPFRGVLQRG